MRKILIVVLMSLMMLPTLAGNKLRDDHFAIDDDGFSVGYRLPYVVDSNLEVLFDSGINDELALEAIEHMNNLLVDIKLDPDLNGPDYSSASQLISLDPKFNLMYEPNRIFVYLGGGFSSQFFASLRVFDSSSQPACFIGLRESLWEQAGYYTQLEILLHELFHCMLWNHPENNPYTDNFDFTSNDNVEVLDRLFDTENTKDKITVDIVKNEEDVVGFIGRKSIREETSTYTIQDQIKLVKGRYKIQVNDRFIRKINKKGVVKYTKKLRKAKKFKLNDCDNKTVRVINEDQ